MKHRAALSFTWCVLLAFQAGCVIAVMDRTESGGLPPGKSLRKTFAFEPGGTVSLENHTGDIDVTGWDEEEAEVIAAGAGSLSRARGIRIVGWRDSAPDVDIDQDGNSLRIKAAASRRGGSERREGVDFVLRVPHSVNLKIIVLRRGDIRIADLYGEAVVDVAEGDCKVENFSGSLLVSAGLGNVEAEVLDLRGGDTIKITVEEGDIILRLEPDVGARIETRAPNGKINADFDSKAFPAAEKTTLELGDKRASVSLLALDGDIQIVRIR